MPKDPDSPLFLDWPDHQPDRALVEKYLSSGFWHPQANSTVTIPRLIVYGTLAPGQENAHVLAPLTNAVWHSCHVPGRVDRTGRYPFFYPGVGWELAQVCESNTLALHIADIDAFEGPEYRRILWPLWTPATGWAVGHIYAAWNADCGTGS